VVGAFYALIWSATPRRLAARPYRDLKGRFDRDAYKFEELVAEISAAMTARLSRSQGSHAIGMPGPPKYLLSASTGSSHTQKGTNDVMGHKQSYRPNQSLIGGSVKPR
jgi:hypothetical protein